MEKVGFIGLGIMGAPMSENLLKGGISLLVNDVDTNNVDRLVKAGATYATLETIAKECDIIITMLPNGMIVKEIAKQLAPNLSSGKLVIDFSSITPSEAIEIGHLLEEKGVDFIDCPVSGGEPKAIDGTLAFMAGGKQEAFDKVQPLFDIMGSSALLIGGIGSGSVTKLANQIIVNNTIAIVSEAFTLAAKAGADLEKVYQAIRGGLAGSTVLDAKIPLILDRNFVAGGKISINHKDIKNVLSTAHDMDVIMPYTAQLFEIMQNLKLNGLMDEDHGAIVKYFENLSKVEVKK